MKRTAFDERRDRAIADEVSSGPCCSACKLPTPGTVLSQLGGRCSPCFDAYCSHGISGGAPGFLTGAKDTGAQAEMRKHLKRSRPVGQAMAKTDEEVDAAARDAAKAATARKVAEYAQRTGQPGTDTRVTRVGAV